jgi:hypothetical protein
LSSGEEATAIAYVQIKTADGKTRWVAGVDTNIELASARRVARVEPTLVCFWPNVGLAAMLMRL